jgi:[ribosomal protein S18]-alanine N-acetyltransferase
MILSLFRRPQPVVVELTGRDAPGLAAIHATGFERGWGEAEFERLLADRGVVGQASRAGGRPGATGFILSRLAGDEAEVLTVAVHPRWRGRGHGALLLRTHLGRLAARGVATLFLEVAEDNLSALALYRRAGFEEVGRRTGYYRREGRPPATALVMRRALR